MAGTYRPLTEYLRASADRGHVAVDLGFDAIAVLVGGLPPSADVRRWWANSSHCQALARRAAGFPGETVSLDHRRVGFTQGERRGSSADRGRVASATAQARRGSRSRLGDGAGQERQLVGTPVEVRVRLLWRAAGELTLDASGKPAFGPLEAAPGLYRLEFASLNEQQRPRVHFGEIDNLRMRLSGNYRDPGPSQQTSLRINGLLCEHLARAAR